MKHENVLMLVEPYVRPNEFFFRKIPMGNKNHPNLEIKILFPTGQVGRASLTSEDALCLAAWIRERFPVGIEPKPASLSIMQRVARLEGFHK